VHQQLAESLEPAQSNQRKAKPWGGLFKQPDEGSHDAPSIPLENLPALLSAQLVQVRWLRMLSGTHAPAMHARRSLLRLQTTIPSAHKAAQS
jgi:hypothetical protein